MFLAGEPQLLGEARHRRHTHQEPTLGSQVRTELNQRCIGVFSDQPAQEAKGGLITARVSAARMGARRDVSAGAAPPQELLDKRLTDAKQGGDGPLRAEPLVTGAEDLCSQVNRIRFHAY